MHLLNFSPRFATDYESFFDEETITNLQIGFNPNHDMRLDDLLQKDNRVRLC